MIGSLAVRSVMSLVGSEFPNYPVSVDGIGKVL